MANMKYNKSNLLQIIEHPNYLSIIHLTILCSAPRFFFILNHGFKDPLYFKVSLNLILNTNIFFS